jgi:hypothetical protein
MRDIPAARLRALSTDLVQGGPTAETTKFLGIDVVDFGQGGGFEVRSKLLRFATAPMLAGAVFARLRSAVVVYCLKPGERVLPRLEAEARDKARAPAGGIGNQFLIGYERYIVPAKQLVRVFPIDLTKGVRCFPGSPGRR